MRLHPVATENTSRLASKIISQRNCASLNLNNRYHLTFTHRAHVLEVNL